MKPTLIIADDLAESRAELRAGLERDFEIVAEAADGVETAQLCERFAPQLVVLDVAMPKMSGIEAIRSILGRMDYPPAIVVVSGIREEEVVLQALEAGACDYLFKPVDADLLRRVLMSFLKLAA